MEANMQKTFILGVGAQKAGTTWLHAQLQQYDEFDMGFTKEYHVFDVLDSKNRWKLVNAAKTCGKLLKTDVDKALQDPSFKRLSFYADPNAYFSYFAGLLNNDGCRITADITPSYSGLSEEVYRHIKEEFNKRGIEVKVIFLMREPICRLSSAVRMRFRRKGKEISDSAVLKGMKRRLGGDGLNSRSDYSATYNNLINVFDEHERFIGFYETLFSPSELKRLCAFLNFGANKFDTAKRYNFTDRKIEIAKPEIDKFVEYFDDTYEFVKQNFDQTIYDTWMEELDKITEGR